MDLFRTLAFFLAGLALPSAAFAAMPPKSFGELVGEITKGLDATTGILIVLAIVVYFWGISSNVLKFEDDPEKRRAYFFWGIFVIFIMVSIWGIIRLLGRTLFGSGF